MKVTKYILPIILLFTLIGCSSGHQKTWVDSVLPQQLDSFWKYIQVIITLSIVKFGLELIGDLPAIVSAIISIIILVYYRDYGFIGVTICIGTPILLRFILAILLGVFSGNRG